MIMQKNQVKKFILDNTKNNTKNNNLWNSVPAEHKLH